MKITLTPKLIYILVAIVLVNCKNKQPKNTNSNELAVEKEEPNYSLKTYTDFLAVFPETSEPLSSELLFSHFLDSDKFDYYERFSSKIQYSFYTDCSEDIWHYQPLFKLKIDNGYLAFMVYNISTYDNPSPNTETFAFMKFILGDEGKYKIESWPVVIGERVKGEITTSFKPTSQTLDTFEINKKGGASWKMEYYEGDYYNLKKWMLINTDSVVPNYVLSDIVRNIKPITNNWSINEELNKLSTKKDSTNRIMSYFFHTKTSMKKTYINSPKDMVPIYNFLGYKFVQDSLCLLIWESQSTEHNEGEIKMALLKDIENVIDLRRFKNNKTTKTNISVTDDNIAVITKNADERIKRIFNPSIYGFNNERHHFMQEFNLLQKFPMHMVIDDQWLQDKEFKQHNYEYSLANKVGKIVTNTQFIILTSESEEITSGSHSVFDGVYCYCYDKKTLQENSSVQLYYYFSDGGDETISKLKDTVIYKYDIYEDEKTYDKIQECSDTLYFTNSGFYKNYVLESSDTVTSTEINFNINNLSENDEFLRLSEGVLIGDFHNLEETDYLFSQYIYSSIYSKEELESYIPMCSPFGKIHLCDSTFALLWHRLPAISTTYKSNISSVMEAAVYNPGKENPIRYIGVIPNWIDTWNEITSFLKKNRN